MEQLATAVYPDVQEERQLRRYMASIQRKLLPSWQLQEVFEHYEVTVPQEFEVVRFLSPHTYLLAVLIEAMPHIRQVFGQCPVYLEVERDPDEGFEELFGVIMANATPEKALTLLAQFDQEWFTQIANRTRGKLNFTVDTTNDESV